MRVHLRNFACAGGSTRDPSLARTAARVYYCNSGTRADGATLLAPVDRPTRRLGPAPMSLRGKLLGISVGVWDNFRRTQRASQQFLHSRPGLWNFYNGAERTEKIVAEQFRTTQLIETSLLFWKGLLAFSCKYFRLGTFWE